MSNAIVPAEATAPSPSEHMIRLSSDYVLSRSLQVVAELGIADLLATGPRTSGALAAETGAHAPSLYRLLRALSGFGVFVEHEDGTFRLTRLGATLRSDGAGSVRNWVLLNSTIAWQSFAELRHSVQTGEPGFDRALAPILAQRIPPQLGRSVEWILVVLEAQGASAPPGDGDFGDIGLA